MSRYLSLAFIGEGSTDFRFLGTLLYRACFELCLASSQTVDIKDEVTKIHPPSRVLENVVSEVKGNEREYSVVFIHRDGKSSYENALIEGIQPIREQLSLPSVAVIPIKETEAWVLADRESVMKAFSGVSDTAKLSGTPEGRALEKLPDPKKTLNDWYFLSTGRKANSKRGPTLFLEQIAGSCRLSELRKLPAYRRFETELLTTLKQMGIL